MILTDQGVLFNYDRNNKRGLFAGTAAWGPDDVKRVYLGAIKDFPRAVAGVYGKIKAWL